VYVTLVLTHACNLACSYCYMGDHHAASMPRDVASAGVKLAFSSPGPVTLGFFGGEPLLELGALLSIADEARCRAADERRALALTVTTNGTLVDEARAHALAERDVRVVLSLDGTRMAHDAARRTRGGESTFDAAVDAARHLGAAGIPLSVIAVVTPDNVRDLGESVRFLSSLGAARIELNPCYEASWSDADLAAWEVGLRVAADVWLARMRAGDPLLLPTFDNKLRAAAARRADGTAPDASGCALDASELAVAPSGRLYTCARLVGEDRASRFVVGDIRTGVDRARLAAFARGPADEACGPCVERWRCSGFCACANVAETGATDRPGGAQCWLEQTSARLADEAGHALLAERSPVFVARTYAGVTRTRRLPIAR